MTDNLTEAGRAAGLTDPDLLKLARTDIEPAKAVEHLRGKYPGAFETMAQVANKMGLTDTAALALVRPGAGPREAIEELQRDYPQAFKPAFHATTATPEERAARWRQLQADEAKRYADAENRAAMAKLEKRFGKRT